jgi:ribosomal protein L12E/L44/L45/RPP1/RPP2
MKSFKLTISGLYANPVNQRARVLLDFGYNLPRTQFVPMYHLLVHQVSGYIKAANNPLSATGQLQCQGIVFEDIGHLSGTPRELPGSKSDPVPILGFCLRLPPMCLSYELTQISTLSRYLDNRVDLSCFDTVTRLTVFTHSGQVTVTVHPLTMVDLDSIVNLFFAMGSNNTANSTVSNNNGYYSDMSEAAYSSNDTSGGYSANSSNSGNSGSGDKMMLWRARRPLAHLWLRYNEWSKVVNNLSRCNYQLSSDTISRPTNTAPTNTVLSPYHVHYRASDKKNMEMRMRQGDWYTIWPQHLNVVKLVTATLSHSNSNSNTNTNNNNNKTKAKPSSTSDTDSNNNKNNNNNNTVHLPAQKLTVRSATVGRALDFTLQLQPPILQLPHNNSHYHHPVPHSHHTSTTSSSAIAGSVPTITTNTATTTATTTATKKAILVAAPVIEDPVPSSTTSNLSVNTIHTATIVAVPVTTTTTTTASAAAVPPVQSQTPQWLQWLVPPSTTTTTTTTTTATNNTAANSKVTSAQNTTRAGATTNSTITVTTAHDVNWMKERQQLLAMIAELQTDNNRLRSQVDQLLASAAAAAATTSEDNEDEEEHDEEEEHEEGDEEEAHQTAVAGTESNEKAVIVVSKEEETSS